MKLDNERLVELGVETTGRIHSTDLKNRILANMPGLQSYKEGRDVLLSYNDDVGNALRNACLDDCDDEAICLAKAAEIIRRDMTNVDTQFDGSSFEQGCQEASVPRSLLALVSMILDRPAITRRAGDESRQATMSISQLLQYNSSVRRRRGSTGVHHRKCKETPLPLYLAMMIHGRTRKRELIDILFQLGLPIPYDRVIEISMDMAISAAQVYESEGVVCPLVLRKNLFTTAAVDNLDHNPSSTTKQGAFHGAGISMRQIPDIQPDLLRKLIPTLPESYTTLTLVTAKQDVVIPPTQSTLTCDHELVNEEAKWQSNTRRLISEDVYSVDDPISWAAFHSNQEPPHDFELTIGSLLPVFPDDSKCVEMIRHAMDVVQQAVHHLNPGQVAVTRPNTACYCKADSMELAKWVWGRQVWDSTRWLAF